MASNKQVANVGVNHRYPNRAKVSSQQVPAFLLKLFEITNDEASNNLIRWSEDGDYLTVSDPGRFAKEVLGQWFKHRNFGSFIRQLNTYGFRKISLPRRGIPGSQTTEESHFKHQCFRRNQPNLLRLIHRRRRSFTTATSSLRPSPQSRHHSHGTINASNSSRVRSVNDDATGTDDGLDELQLARQEVLAARHLLEKQRIDMNHITQLLEGALGCLGVSNEADSTHRRNASADTVSPSNLPGSVVHDFGQFTDPLGEIRDVSLRTHGVGQQIFADSSHLVPYVFPAAHDLTVAPAAESSRANTHESCTGSSYITSGATKLTLLPTPFETYDPYIPHGYHSTVATGVVQHQSMTAAFCPMTNAIPSTAPPLGTTPQEHHIIQSPHYSQRTYETSKHIMSQISASSSATTENSLQPCGSLAEVLMAIPPVDHQAAIFATQPNTSQLLSSQHPPSPYQPSHPPRFSTPSEIHPHPTLDYYSTVNWKESNQANSSLESPLRRVPTYQSSTPPDEQPNVLLDSTLYIDFMPKPFLMEGAAEHSSGRQPSQSASPSARGPTPPPTVRGEKRKLVDPVETQPWRAAKARRHDKINRKASR